MATQYENLEMLIDGKWCQGSTGITEPVTNPATGAVLGHLPHASTDDLDRALAASQRGFEVWRRTTPIERQEIIERVLELVIERKDQIARTLTLEQGKPLSEANTEMGQVTGLIKWYAEEAKRSYGRIVPSRNEARQMVLKEPVGPAVAFTAWNFPALNAVRKMAGAVSAGCSLILKASEETPGTAVALARAYQDAGLPDGVLNLVFGVPSEVSTHLMASPIPRKLAFTGSVAVGKHLSHLAADTLKRATMELGGHAPFIVTADANFEHTVDLAAFGKFRNAGQVCVSPTRFYVESSIVDRFTDALVAKAEALTLGDGTDPATTMGPVIADRRISWFDGLLDDARSHGARVLVGGARAGNQGTFYAPTVVRDAPEDSRIQNEEPFGPIASINSFATLDEALERANRLAFGLAGYGFTGSGAAARTIEAELNAGVLAINNLGVSTPETPFGGVNESGQGSEGGIEGLSAYQRTKFVSEMFV